MGERVAIAVGGSGGHLFPAQSLACQLRREKEGVEILFLGSGLSKSPFFDQKGFAYKDIPSAGLSLSCPQQWLFNAGKLLLGTVKAAKELLRYRPSLVIGFGSYHSFPVLLAARGLHIPYLLHTSDAIPGKVIRLFASHALATAIHFPQCRSHLEGKTVEVAMTLREAFLQPLPTKEEACSFYGLDPQLPTFLIFGGSQGAQRLNELALQLVEELKKEGNPVQILHFIGPRADAAALESLYRVLCPDPQWKFVVRSFEPRMEMSWAAADLAICRSGATTLAEQIHMCVPSILIPFPSAADGHQEKNAEFMAQQVQGALMIKEEQATGQKLKQMVKELLAQQGLRLKAMKQRLCEHKQRPLCKDMSTLIVEMLADLK